MKSQVDQNRDRVLNGETVIMSNGEYDLWIDDDMPLSVASVKNPNQIGTKDELLVYVKR